MVTHCESNDSTLTKTYSRETNIENMFFENIETDRIIKKNISLKSATLRLSRDRFLCEGSWGGSVLSGGARKVLSDIHDNFMCVYQPSTQKKYGKLTIKQKVGWK